MATFKVKWKVRSLQRLPKKEPEGWKPNRRRVVLEKMRKSNLGKGVMCTVPLLTAA